MSKRILILVISSLEQPYLNMISTSNETWDSVEIEGCETVYYHGTPIRPVNFPHKWQNKALYIPVMESYATMGRKTLSVFQWALAHKEFDYVARINSSTFVDKIELMKYIEDLPLNNVFSGLKVEAGEQYPFAWVWGCAYILSKDLVNLVVSHSDLWDHKTMDDVSMGKLMNEFEIPYTSGRMSTIDKMATSWRCLCYGGESFEYKDWNEFKKPIGQYFFRCKHDPDRSVDKLIMNELFARL